ncbi:MULTISPECIES: hypothetical protein [unclassified Adlercreutzia]|uniref:hypothetical protein n=1 Tax=unclassified Adlercreutzia TaxID=2636013 RepID=UPI0013EB225F|nr:MULTISPECIES: hypothetical protein [unclassified Adlercreutzia]
MKTLVITFDNESMLSGYKACLPPSVDMFNIFRRVSKIAQAVRMAFSRIGFMPCFFLESWVESLSDYSLIIVMDSSRTASCLHKVLRRLGYSGRICYYYWNTVEGDKKAANPWGIDRKECELWSFDPRECREYNMHFNPSFYSRMFSTMAKSSSIRKSREGISAYFMGLEKGRLAKIMAVENALIAAGVETRFYVVKDETSSEVTSSDFCYSDSIPYSENILKVEESDILVEITKPNQEGVTIRTLEALFFGKKLITDNRSVRCLNLYNHNNVYIIDERFPDGLFDFIKTPYVEPHDELLDYYSFESWLERFSYPSSVDGSCELPMADSPHQRPDAKSEYPKTYYESYVDNIAEWGYCGNA